MISEKIDFKTKLHYFGVLRDLLVVLLTSKNIIKCQIDETAFLDFCYDHLDGICNCLDYFIKTKVNMDIYDDEGATKRLRAALKKVRDENNES